MNILQFIEQFPDERSCREHLRTMREREGVICKRCHSKGHWWLKAKWQWQCSNCDFRTTLRSGTVMECAKLPVRKWYMAMAFMSFTKKGLSACEMQRQIGHRRYESIWSMMHRIRRAMGQRDDLYLLDGAVEFDEGFFEKSTPQGTELKRGKGSQRQQNVAVMAESTPLEDIGTGKRSRHCRYFKMKVLESQESEAINNCVRRNMTDRTVVFSDKASTYTDIADLVETHITEKSDANTTRETLKWVHIAISNAKRTLLGVNHHVKGMYLQLYLNEFCYKLNRRHFGRHLFERLSLAMAHSYWYANG